MTTVESAARADAMFARLRALLGARLDERLQSINRAGADHDEAAERRIDALCALVLGEKDCGDEQQRLCSAEARVTAWLAQVGAEERLDHLVDEELQRREKDAYRRLQLSLLRRETGPDTATTLERYAQLCRMDDVSLSSAQAAARPVCQEELVGQNEAWRALLSAVATPFPQHVILYGPPGVGKTSAARLALQAAVAMGRSPFQGGAPFVEVDGATLRWDERGAVDPLLGSVHDPIYQGARQGLGEGGVPEPRTGLVTAAHGGVLFIDEIGEMPLPLQNRLLKALEDKRVRFDSPYYDPADPSIPQYIHKLFRDGAPADFVLIGATTRPPEQLAPALRSRCAQVRFAPLGPCELRRVVCGAAGRMGIAMTQAAALALAEAALDGRQAVRMLQAAYGHALRLGQERVDVRAVRQALRDAGCPSAMPLRREPAVGCVQALGVLGYSGCILRLEAVAVPGRGELQFNGAAGEMARDAVRNALVALRVQLGCDTSAYDVTVNAAGGGQVDGPSLGLAAALAVGSAVRNMPLRQDVGVTGEIGLHGDVLPVGGLPEKLDAARRAHLSGALLPCQAIARAPLPVTAVQTLAEAWDKLAADGRAEASA